MATRKSASKKGGAKKGGAKKGGAQSRGFSSALGSALGGALGGAVGSVTGASSGGGLVGVSFKATDRLQIDQASRVIAQAVERAVAGQQLPGGIRGPILCGIWYDPISKKVQVFNQFG
jgi:hypothetical protein